VIEEIYSSFLLPQYLSIRKRFLGHGLRSREFYNSHKRGTYDVPYLHWSGVASALKTGVKIPLNPSSLLTETSFANLRGRTQELLVIGVTRKVDRSQGKLDLEISPLAIAISNRGELFSGDKM